MKEIGFWHYNQGEEMKVCGRFQITAVPAMGPFVGQGFTPTRAGVGDYLLTFTGAAARMTSAKATCQCAAATDLDAQIGAFTAGAAGAATLQIRTKAAGANTEVTALDWVHFEVTLYGECLAT